MVVDKWIDGCVLCMHNTLYTFSLYIQNWRKSPPLVKYLLCTTYPAFASVPLLPAGDDGAYGGLGDAHAAINCRLIDVAWDVQECDFAFSAAAAFAFAAVTVHWARI
jgi:hypothetical protein